MVKKRKYPKIEPQFLKSKSGKAKAVYLDYDVYESIFEEMKELKQKIKKLKKKKKK